ncbi:multiple cyclophane-containing RiPP AmcA [Microbispora amethystogenes]|uniref:multiple cyclophane-containing RiPP AmcA n=1 Tax=Microbispora amethystogenes TaxID=1427754 RepID=UPI0033DC0BCE
MTPLQELATTTASLVEDLVAAYAAAAPGVIHAGHDNRPSWDNTGKTFDNKPSWDNWSNT